MILGRMNLLIINTKRDSFTRLFYNGFLNVSMQKGMYVNNKIKTVHPIKNMVTQLNRIVTMFFIHYLFFLFNECVFLLFSIGFLCH